MMIITMMMKMPTIMMMMRIIITPVNESPCEVEEVGGSPVAAPSHSCEHKYKVNCIWKYGCVYTTNTKKQTYKYWLYAAVLFHLRAFCWVGFWGVDRCVIVVDELHSCLTTVSRKGFVEFAGEVLMSVLLWKTILVYITIICRWSGDEGWWLGDSLSPIEIYTPTLSHRPNTDRRN